MVFAVAHTAEHASTPAEPHAQAGSLQTLLSGGARITEAAQAAWSGLVCTGETVVDATCGNGHDTLALARLVGPSGCIIAMDIQVKFCRCQMSNSCLLSADCIK